MNVLLAAITPSTTNPRKRFDQDALDELAADIKRHNVLQPILLRPNGGPGSYELVAGERRFRAAKAAGLTEIPATVRELTDAEVLEIQIAENLHRKDLHELEEAESYERLLKCVHPSGEKYTVDDIVAKVGRSRTYVFGRLKLCALCPEAKKVFLAGDIDASKALLIARIGHHDTQRQALKDITQGRYGNGQPMATREAHQHILNNYMLALKSAPFDIKDEKLLAKAGACGPCPKRTGNQADLFGDVKSADVCTDPKCFGDKRLAHFGIAARKLEAAGNKVISGDAAKKILPHWEHQQDIRYTNIAGGYVRLDENTYAAGGRGRKVSDLLGADFKPVFVQHPGTGEVVKVASQQAVTAAAAKTARKGGAKGGTSRSSAPREKAPTPDELFRARLFVAIMNKIPETLGKAELQLLAKAGVDACDSTDLLADFFVPLKDGKKHDVGYRALEAAIPKMAPKDLARLAVAGVIGANVAYGYGKPKELLEAAATYKVDQAKIKKAIADEAKTAAAAAKDAASAKKAKPAKKVKPTKVATFTHAKTNAVTPDIAPLIKPMITPLVRPMGPIPDNEPTKRAKKAEAKKAAKRAKPMASFMEPHQPSAALAVIVGDKPMARTEITSKLWGYIKKHQLQDTKNRRMINMDDAMAAVFGSKKAVSMFEMTKVVAKHLKRV